MVIGNIKKTIFIIFITFGVTINSYSQKLTFVKDSIMDEYMKTGYSTKNFIPTGTEDKNKKRQGFWKDFEVVKDFEYITVDGIPTEIFGRYLLYGEGKFVDGKREGNWKFYVLEDKTFNKILQKKVTFNKGEKVGEFVYFFPSEKTGVKGEYTSNLFEGEVKFYYEDGKLFRKRLYSKGLKSGKNIRFYPNGQLEVELTYVRDTLHGPYDAYYSNGNKNESLTYKMGKEDGVYKFYHENGQLWVEREYNNGLLMNIKGNFDPQGNQRDKGTIKDGNGTVKYYKEDGKLYVIENYKDGKKISEEKQ